MTPEQQTELRTRVRATPACAQALANKNLDALASILNANPGKTLQSRYVTARTILAECADGPAILDALSAAAEQVSAVKWALNFLGKDSGLDVGNPATQGMIDQLTGVGMLRADQAAALKGMALQPALVTREQINDALFNPNGTEK